MRKSMKKLWLITIPLCLVAVAAVGCGKEHTHEYSTAWAFDATAHWHPSTCSHDTKTNKSEHSFVSVTIPPSTTSQGYTLYTCACGYSYTSDTVGSLPVESGEYRFDENGHWKLVLDGGQVNVEKHEYSDSVVESTCTTFGYTKHTCVCGYWYASDPTAPTEHTYNDAVWDHDENGHWHPALCCNAKSGNLAHNFTERVVPCEESDDPQMGGYTLFTCTVCGYSYRQEIGHSYSDTFDGDEYEHWRNATCSHSGEKADVAEHALVGRSNVCVVCGKEVAPRLSYELSANKDYYIVTGIGCWLENDVVIPENYLGKPVREIADRAFKGEPITAVTFEANLTKIGVDAFADTQISSVNLSGIEELGTRAFAGSKIVSLTLGASLNKIGNGAFRNCTNLQTVSIEGNLTTLPAYVFEGCAKLQTLTCSGTEKVKEIGAQAFLDCAELTTLDLSECEKIGYAAFAGCNKFAPADLNKLAVADEYAFFGNAIESVTLPMLEQLPANLFAGCEKLTSATLSAIGIGASAFKGCILLETLSLTGTELIGVDAFKNCEKLTALTLPETVIRVGKGAFEGTGLVTSESGVHYAANVLIGADSGVKTVTVKADAVGIADGAFQASASLSSVTLGQNVRFIGVDAFRKCEALTAIAFTESVKYIGANSFRESGLVTVTVPGTVKSVGDNAFYDCKSLEAVSVSAQMIGKFAFSYTGVGRTLGSPVKQRPDYAKLTSVTLGSGVKEIGSNAFQYCPITGITLPESVTKIGKYAFAQTDLTQITIPAQVTFIGEYAFYDCKSLSAVTFADTQNWKAGKTRLNLSNASQNVTYLKTTYLDYDWIKGETE